MRNQELQLAEAQEREEERQRQVELVKFLKKQSDEKRMQSEKQFVHDNQASLEAQALLDQ